MLRVVTGDEVQRTLEDEVKSSIFWWKQALARPDECMYLIWSPDFHPHVKEKLKPIYAEMLSAAGEEKVRFKARKSWGNSLLRNLSKRYNVEEHRSSITQPDHREAAEWVRQNCPLAVIPDWEQHLYYNTVKLYLRL